MKEIKKGHIITYKNEEGNRITGIVVEQNRTLMVNTGDVFLEDINTDNIRKLGRISYADTIFERIKKYLTS